MKRNKPLKTIQTFTFRFFELFFAFLTLYLIITILGASIPVGSIRKQGDLYIYVQSNGIHTDICLPTNSEQINWQNFIPIKHFPRNKNFDFITIGWGDKGFFLDTPKWSDLTFSTAFNAAFLPSSTLMHVKYGKEPRVSINRKRVYLKKSDYFKIIRFVKKSFVLDGENIQLIVNKGYTDSDNFYSAHNSYHMFRTCNIWTNEVLKEAGVRTGIYALFPDGILTHL